ncbi:gp28 [Brochothrix phage BL3]|uniref:gp28 n=1 Tax=Brochothrix phage BL3 TaxID=764562 RepID=UPI0001D9ADC5|nr:gp28 [Brochothrix phage BL3]ADH03109.1 gp28 [Brochothrix phage BL3]
MEHIAPLYLFTYSIKVSAQTTSTCLVFHCSTVFSNRKNLLFYFNIDYKEAPYLYRSWGFL